MRSLYISWTPFASWCLDEIYAYILRKSFSKKTADRQIQRIISRVEQLKKFPVSGQVEPFLKAIGQNSRYLVEGNYKIIYQLTAEQIIVTDVFHTKQSPQKISRSNKSGSL